jgi:uncharacterized protein (DUF58 family)
MNVSGAVAGPPVLARSPRLLAYTGVAAAGLLAALIFGRPEFAVLAAPFAVILVTGLALVTDPALGAEVAVDSARVLQGDVIEVTATVTSTVAVPRLEVLLTLPDGLALEGGKGAFAAAGVAVAPNDPAVLRWQVACPRWGSFRTGTVALRAHDRSGLLQWSSVCDCRVRVKVLPSAGILKSLVSPHRTLATAGNQVTHNKGEGVEFADIRAFRVGDRPRAVNWRATARRGELWVNERHTERNADIVLFLDSFADPDVGNAALERAVRAACSLAAGYLRNRDRVGVIDFGGLQWLTPAMGQAALYRIIDVLVTATPLWTEADRTINLVPGRLLPPRSLVIALTPLLDPRIDDVLIELRRRRVDLVVVEIDAETSAANPEGPFGPLALRLWRLDRDRRRHTLERLGAIVVRWRDDEPLAQIMAEVDRCHRRRHA